HSARHPSVFEPLRGAALWHLHVPVNELQTQSESDAPNRFGTGRTPQKVFGPGIIGVFPRRSGAIRMKRHIPRKQLAGQWPEADGLVAAAFHQTSLRPWPGKRPRPPFELVPPRGPGPSAIHILRPPAPRQRLGWTPNNPGRPEKNAERKRQEKGGKQRNSMSIVF